jgi:hypothetical protein
MWESERNLSICSLLVSSHYGQGTRDDNWLLWRLDGGQAGLSALFILKEMFQRLKYDLKSEEDIRPCDWFDMMMGTDTGG